MRTIFVSLIGVSSILFVVMMQNTVSRRMWTYEKVENALSSAMEQTMSEVMEHNQYGIKDRNEMLAALLQSMIAKWDPEVDLTVAIHKLDYEKRQMDVEVTGKFASDKGNLDEVKVRRKVVFEQD